MKIWIFKTMDLFENGEGVNFEHSFCVASTCEEFVIDIDFQNFFEMY